MDDINDFVPSLLHPRCLKRSENDLLSQTSIKHRSPLSLLKKRCTSGSLISKKPLADNNNWTNNIEKSSLDINVSAIDKENIAVRDHNWGTDYSVNTTPKNRQSARIIEKKVLQQGINNFKTNKQIPKNTTVSQQSTDNYKSNKHKTKSGTDVGTDIANNHKVFILRSKKPVNIKLDIKKYKQFTLDTDSETVIKKIHIVNKNNIMHVDCVLQSTEVIILSDSDDVFEDDGRTVKTPDKHSKKKMTGNESTVKKSENLIIQPLPFKHSKSSVMPRKREMKNSSSAGKNKSTKNTSKHSKNNSKSQLNSSLNSSTSSLKQSTLFSFLSSKSTLVDNAVNGAVNEVVNAKVENTLITAVNNTVNAEADNAVNETVDNESNASTYILNINHKDKAEVTNSTTINENPLGEIAYSSTISIFKEEELIIDDDDYFPDPISSDMCSTILTERPYDKTHTDLYADDNSNNMSPILDPIVNLLAPKPTCSGQAAPVFNFPVPENVVIQKNSKPVPSYKIIEGTPFAVDAFCYGDLPNVASYFLTHFHSDHYIGLRRTFNKPLFCTRISADLCKMKLGVNANIINILELDQTIIVNGIEVTAVEANHCPGAVMLVFSLPNGTNILHCGDFRANQLMESYPILWTKDIQTIYLDTTYCNPRYEFPSQLDSILKAVHLLRVKKEQMDQAGLDFKRVLIVCGTYCIGKEKFFKGIAEYFDCKIWVDPDKNKVLKIVEGKCYNSLAPSLCQLHVVSLMDLSFDKLANHLLSVADTFDEIVAFRPTGWQTNKISHSRRGNIIVHGIPYSEHSSFSELKRFVRFLRPTKIIPTVIHAKQDFQKYFSSWLSEKQDIQTRVSDYFKTMPKS